MKLSFMEAFNGMKGEFIKKKSAIISFKTFWGKQKHFHKFKYSRENSPGEQQGAGEDGRPTATPGALHGNTGNAS